MFGKPMLRPGGSDTQASSPPAPLAKKSNDDQPPFQPSY